MISLACNLRWFPWILGCHVFSHHHFYSPFLSTARGCLFRHQFTSSHFDKSLQLNLLFIFKFTFVEMSIALVFYFFKFEFVRVKILFKTWHKSIIKFNFIPLCLNLFTYNYSISKPFNKLQILSLLFKFTLYKSSSIDLNLVNTNGVSTFL
jgi:hypothetical protein